MNRVRNWVIIPIFVYLFLLSNYVIGYFILKESWGVFGTEISYHLSNIFADPFAPITFAISCFGAVSIKSIFLTGASFVGVFFLGYTVNFLFEYLDLSFKSSLTIGIGIGAFLIHTVWASDIERRNCDVVQRVKSMYHSIKQELPNYAYRNHIGHLALYPNHSRLGIPECDVEMTRAVIRSGYSDEQMKKFMEEYYYSTDLRY